MKVPTRNAFEMNRLGMSGKPFPFSVSCYNPEHNIWTMYLYPQRMRDICDLFETYGVTQWAVFDVSHVYLYDAKTSKPLSLSEVATDFNVMHQVIEPGFIVLSTEGFCQLLQEFEHFDLTAFGVLTKPVSEDQLIEQYLRLLDWQRSERNRLSALSDSNIYLSSHDDCYLHVEAHNPEFLKSIFRRALASYVGTVLREVERPIEILPDVPLVVIEELWPRDEGLTILRHQTSLIDEELQIGVVPKAFNFRSAGTYEPVQWVKYDLTDQSWDLS